MLSIDIGWADIDTDDAGAGDAGTGGAVLGPAAIVTVASAKRVLDEMVDTGWITKSTYFLTGNLKSAGRPVEHRSPSGLPHPCEPIDWWADWQTALPSLAVFRFLWRVVDDMVDTEWITKSAYSWKHRMCRGRHSHGRLRWQMSMSLPPSRLLQRNFDKIVDNGWIKNQLTSESCNASGDLHSRCVGIDTSQVRCMIPLEGCIPPVALL